MSLRLYILVGATMDVSDDLHVLADEVSVQNLFSIILTSLESYVFEFTIYIPELFLKHVLNFTGF